MTTLSLIPPPFRKLTPMGTTERPSPPRSSLEETAAIPRLEVGWGGPKPKRGASPRLLRVCKVTLHL